MTTFKKTLLAAMIAAPMVGTAQAAIVLNDWTLDLSVVNAALPTVQNISELTFTGIAHAVTANEGGPAGPVGDTGVTDGLLSITSFVDTGGGIIGGTNLNNTYEITADFSVDATVVSVDPVTGTQTFAHLATGISDGLLDIFVDDQAGCCNSSKGSGLGYVDGTKIATFRIVTGEGGGSFTPLSLDGSDDATFELIFALPGVFLDSGGVALALGTTLGITDSNFDADPDNNGVADTTFTPGDATVGFNDWTACLNNLTQPSDFCAFEDGSFTIAEEAIPEPSLLALMGAGLLGMAGIRRRKQS